jgi:class 3 adenylate cyclase
LRLGWNAEEWRDLVNAHLDGASAAVTEMGCHVAKKLGDGLMALFGYPLAHENNAERVTGSAVHPEINCSADAFRLPPRFVFQPTPASGP